MPALQRGNKSIRKSVHAPQHSKPFDDRGNNSSMKGAGLMGSSGGFGGIQKQRLSISGATEGGVGNIGGVDGLDNYLQLQELKDKLEKVQIKIKQTEDRGTSSTQNDKRLQQQMEALAQVIICFGWTIMYSHSGGTLNREQRTQYEQDVLQHSRNVLIWIKKEEALGWDPDNLKTFAISCTQDIEGWNNPSQRRQRKTTTASKFNRPHTSVGVQPDDSRPIFRSEDAPDDNGDGSLGLSIPARRDRKSKTWNGEARPSIMGEVDLSDERPLSTSPMPNRQTLADELPATSTSKPASPDQSREVSLDGFTKNPDANSEANKSSAAPLSARDPGVLKTPRIGGVQRSALRGKDAKDARSSATTDQQNKRRDNSKKSHGTRTFETEDSMGLPVIGIASLSK